MKTTDLNDTTGPAITPTPMSKTPDLQELEAKIDKILDYQKGVYHWAIVRGIVDFLIFMVFIVIPIIGSVYLYKYVATQVDFGKLSSQYGQITKGLNQLDSLNTAGGMPNVTDLLNKINATK